jgi:hypothetical protein
MLKRQGRYDKQKNTGWWIFSGLKSLLETGKPLPKCDPFT